MLRWLATSLFLVSVVAALAWALWPRPLPVETAAIGKRDITVAVEEEGKARIREIYSISAPINGQTLRVERHAGDYVQEGETLVSIRPAAPGLLDARLKRVAEAAAASTRAAVGLALAEVKQAEAQLVFLRTELSRAERLLRQGAISESARDKAKLAVDTASANLDSANASLEVRQRELERAEAALIETATPAGPCCTEIKAPVSGQILRVLAESEQVVTAGMPLMEIGDPANIEITADILSRDAVEVKPGASAVISNWGGPDLLARVRTVAPSATTKVSALGIEEQRVTVTLDLKPEEQLKGLGDGFRVVVNITVWEGNNVLAVPISALFRQGDDWAVYRLMNGEAKLQIVKLGRGNDFYSEILSGLTPSDLVILHPSDQITNGTPVVPIDQN